MRSGGGKAKGSDFERQICRKLSLWVSNGKDSNLFWRSAMSGGRATIQLAKGIKNKNQAGDISAIAHLGHKMLDEFVIECKFYNNLAIESGFIKNRGILHDFWFKLCKYSKTLDKQPMLIAKQNYFPDLVILKPFGSKLLHLGRLQSLVYLPQWSADVYTLETVLTAGFLVKIERVQKVEQELKQNLKRNIQRLVVAF